MKSAAPAKFGYRVATAADVPALATMNLMLLRDEENRLPLTLCQANQRMAGWLSSEYVAILFEAGGKPVGYALYRPEDDQIFLRKFYVTAAVRRAGIGRHAMAWLQSTLWGAASVRLECLSTNRLGQAFWRALGFRDQFVSMERRCREPGHE